MKYLHTMVRISDVDESIDFYCNKLGLVELKRYESEQGRFTLIFLAAPGDEDAQIELTYNWDPEDYTGGRNFGHLAFETHDTPTTRALTPTSASSGEGLPRPFLSESES